MIEFKEYTSRFISGFITSYQDNGHGTGAIMIDSPQYQTVEVVQINGSESIKDVEQLINSKSVGLVHISRCEGNPLICYPFHCLFEASNFNPGYQLKINPDDYLIWDVELHKFFAIPEATFLLLYKQKEK